MSLLVLLAGQPAARRGGRDRAGAGSSAATWRRAGGELVVPAYAVEPLPAGAVVPVADRRTNILDRAAVAAALRAALERARHAARAASRWSFPIWPRRCRWCASTRSRRGATTSISSCAGRCEKSAPFPVEDACVTYTPGAQLPDGGARVRRRGGAARHRRGVRRRLRRRPALTRGSSTWRRSASSTCFWPRRRAARGDWLLVHMRPEYTSIAILRGGDVIFFRNRPEGDDESAHRRRAPDGDVLPGSAGRPGLRARAARWQRARGRVAADGARAASKSGWACA